MNDIRQNCRKNFSTIIQLLSPYAKFMTLEADCTHYEGVPLRVIQKLGDLYLIDPNETQNDSPSINAMVLFAAAHPDAGITFHGYVIGPKRDDCRVSVEGLKADMVYKGDGNREDFLLFCRNADELDVTKTTLYAWWD